MAYDEDYERQMVAWAQKYNAYERIAESDELQRLIIPLHEGWEASQRVPEWAGVDLLRAWAFFCARSHRWSGYQPFLVDYPVVEAIADAIRAHPGAKKRDMPPDRAGR